MGAGTKEVATIEALPDKVNFLKERNNKLAKLGELSITDSPTHSLTQTSKTSFLTSQRKSEDFKPNMKNRGENNMKVSTRANQMLQVLLRVFSFLKHQEMMKYSVVSKKWRMIAQV